MFTIFYGEKWIDAEGKAQFKGKNAKWILGEPQPSIPVFAHKCVIVEASGEELDHIVRRFRNIPIVDKITPKTSVSWIGDDARFIVANLVD